MAKAAGRPGRKKAPASSNATETGPATRRSKGRPRSQDPKVGPADILRAACELLQSAPINKVTSAAVARRVGVHPALINYYFKTRSELLVATAAHLMHDLRAMTDFDTTLSASAEESLRTRLAGVMGFHARFPFVHRLIVDEVLNSSSPVARTVFEEMTSVGLQGYADFLKRGVQSGELRQVEPTFLYLATIGMCEFFNSGRAIVDYARGPGDPEAVDEQYLNFMIGLILRGLEPR